MKPCGCWALVQEVGSPSTAPAGLRGHSQCLLAEQVQPLPSLHVRATPPACSSSLGNRDRGEGGQGQRESGRGGLSGGPRRAAPPTAVTSPELRWHEGEPVPSEYQLLSAVSWGSHQDLAGSLWAGAWRGVRLGPGKPRTRGGLQPQGQGPQAASCTAGIAQGPSRGPAAALAPSPAASTDHSDTGTPPGPQKSPISPNYVARRAVLLSLLNQIHFWRSVSPT